MIRIFDEAKVPFVVTMGNHDAEHMAKDDIYDLLLESPYYAGAKRTGRHHGMWQLCDTGLWLEKQRRK